MDGDNDRTTSIYLTEKANITGTFKEANKAIKANSITVNGTLYLNGTSDKNITVTNQYGGTNENYYWNRLREIPPEIIRMMVRSYAMYGY